MEVFQQLLISDLSISLIGIDVCISFSYVVSQILSGEIRETIVENIHSELQRVSAEANEGKVPLELFYITKVSNFCNYSFFFF